MEIENIATVVNHYYEMVKLLPIDQKYKELAGKAIDELCELREGLETNPEPASSGGLEIEEAIEILETEIEFISGDCGKVDLGVVASKLRQVINLIKPEQQANESDMCPHDWLEFCQGFKCKNCGAFVYNKQQK